MYGGGTDMSPVLKGWLSVLIFFILHGIFGKVKRRFKNSKTSKNVINFCNKGCLRILALYIRLTFKPGRDILTNDHFKLCMRDTGS